MTGRREPIAIVGVGCRFPGADGPRAYWQLLVDGVDAITEIPASRFDARRYSDPAPATPGRINTRWGGFLRHAEEFDAEFFGISPREAERLDPQQRWLLETAWEALEDAGAVPSRLAGSRTGVFVGMWINEYENRLFRDPRALDFYMTIGSGRYAASGRLSYALGFEGPSITVDSGCSASLAAVHLACQSLWTGESAMALAAGVNAILEPSITIAYSQSRMMAPDGRCKFGDARANGYVRSEGAGIVVLKRLADAVAAGDRIYATILGSSLNNDGRSSGFLTTPGSGGQQQMLRQAYRDAGVPPATVSYVEAHGTGTRAGDPVELEALGLVLGEGRPADAVCRVGSVKTNIGHTEGAAGLAGLIKVALSLHHRLLPKSLHFETPNPDIPWAELPLRVQRENEPWPPTDDQPVAGVSSFGIAGTNAHVVLQGVPPAAEAPAGDQSRPFILGVSAASDRALSDRLRQVRDVVADPGTPVAGVCWTSNVRRDALDCRAAMVARTREDLVAQIDAAIAGESRPGVARGRRPLQRANRVVFVFPGQGSQWLGMGRQLLEREPAFRDAIAACDTAIRQETGWSVIEQLVADEASSRLREIDVVQPVLFSIEVALAALWRSWGIEPDAVVGHSMGEVAAAHVAGVLTHEQAAQIICRRSRLLLRTSGKGAMALVDLGMAETETALRGREDLLSVAVSNSSRSTVVSGDPAALDALLAELQSRDVFCRRVKVDVASHSPQMDPLRDDLLAALNGLAPRDGDTVLCSTVSGELCDGRTLDAAYWVRNLRSPVLFSTAIARLLADGHDTFIEMSPHPILVPAILEGISEHNAAGAVAIGSTRRDEDEQVALLSSLAALFAAGHPIDFERICSPAALVDLPAYPWQRERYWFEAPSQLDLVTGSRQATPQATTHALVPAATTSADRPGAALWQFELDAAAIRRACGETVGDEVPSALYLELLFTSARSLMGASPLLARDFQVLVPQRVPDRDAAVQIQIVADLVAPSSYSWRLFSNAAGDWTEHARASIAMDGDAAMPSTPDGSAQVGIDAARAQELELYAAHPEIVGAALQKLSDRAGASKARVAGVRRCWLRGPLSCEVSVELATRADGHHLALRNHDGEAVAGIEGVSFAAAETASRAAGSSADWSYTLEWHELSPATVTEPNIHRWALVATDRRLAQPLADALLTRGDDVAVIEDAAALPAWLAARGSGSAGVVHFVDEFSGALAVRAEALTKMALQTAQSVIARETDDADLRLWFVTSGAQAVHPRQPVNCSQSPVWGLARTISEEHPSVWGGIVDLQNDCAPEDVVTALMPVLASADGEDQVSVRDRCRYGLRLVRTPLAESPFPVRANRTYLIAGGLGNLGLQLARWLSGRGARRLVLVGRSGLPSRDASSLTADEHARIVAVEALEQTGAIVRVAALDIADRPRVDALLVELKEQGWPELGAVFQCAGVTEGNLLSEMREDKFDRVWRAKVPGTCALIDATADCPLDAFVMFSSMASFLPSPGQASYAAANAFLDGQAASGHSLGRRVLSINWGPWADIGMAADLSRRGALGVGARGFQNLAIDQALTALEKVAGGSSRPQVAIMSFDSKKWRPGAAVPLLAQLAALEPAAAADGRTPANLRDQLDAAADDVQRRTILETVLQSELATVLKRPAARIELTAPVRPMGLDSLMALELRNRLEGLTGLRLPATLAWNNPTVVAMAAFIGDKLQVFSRHEAVVPDAAADEIERLLAEIEQMPDAEARRLALEGQ